MLYLMVGLLLFGAVLVWLFAVVSFNAWRSRRLMDRVLAPYLLARGLCLQTYQGHVWRRRGRIGRPRPGQVLPLGSLVVLADGPATVSGACRGAGWFDGLGEDGLVVRLVGQYVQPPEQATGPWYAGRICSVGGAACGPGVVPGGDVPLPEVGVGHTPDPDLVTFTQDQVSLLVWKGPGNPVTRLLRARRVRALAHDHQREDPVRRKTRPTPHWQARRPAWWRYEAIGYLPDRFTRVYWDRVRNQPLKAPMRYRTPEAREYNRQHYAAPICTTALIVTILLVAFRIARAWHRSRPHRPLKGGEVLLGMPPLTSEIVCCVLGLALGIGTWAWATHRQFSPRLMTPASSRELQTALDNFNIGMRYITGTTIPYTIHVLAYTALVLTMAYPFMDDFFIHGFDNFPDWFKAYLFWPTFILAGIGLIISTIDVFYAGWIANRLDRELAE
ncbi:hypothetical protein J3T91_05980 [Bifidobacterium sp. B4001]|uniref:hypothetical protein n=1 Tax=unclassified Bifidobacterium TaxID=2608897 RepID=UPI00226B835D|nr:MULTISPECIES: hypothetical protein [unclassified Bifidobacterium]MCX8673060.1 hypothetical protein [Bifidobacterium sp. B4079]MCX8681493.1 hypothetical protein [Bifidobacterium sp. B4001]